MAEFRKCDDKNCDLPATHGLVWTKQQYYCTVHLRAALMIADAMGFPTPANTTRQLRIDELYIDNDSEGDADEI